MRRLLSKKQVKELLGVSYATIDRYEADPKLGFPKRLRLGHSARYSRCGWWEHEVLEWLDNRPRG